MAPGIKESVRELEEQLSKIEYAKNDSVINDTCAAIAEVKTLLIYLNCWIRFRQVKDREKQKKLNYNMKEIFLLNLNLLNLHRLAKN